MTEGVAGVSQSAGALPNLAQLRALVYAPLDDSSRSYFETWFVDSLLNEAYRDLVARLRFKVEEATGTTTADGTLTVPSDFVEHIDLWIGVAPVLMSTDTTFQSWAVPSANTPYDTSGVEVIIGRFSDINTIETYPVQDEQDYTLRYAARPVAMVADSDTPADLTYELCPRIVNYARAYLKWQQNEEAEGDKYMALYEQGLPGAPREAFRLRPGPFSLIPDPGPFG